MRKFNIIAVIICAALAFSSCSSSEPEVNGLASSSEPTTTVTEAPTTLPPTTEAPTTLPPTTQDSGTQRTTPPETTTQDDDNAFLFFWAMETLAQEDPALVTEACFEYANASTTDREIFVRYGFAPEIDLSLFPGWTIEDVIDFAIFWFDDTCLSA